ncbi:MAG TPA: HD domain-containing phosphohydrolase [bacterium]|nr:HD domain-containing phosphohydrolase [bacterium]
MILARKSQMKYYRIPLYVRTDKGEYVLYKPEGMLLADMRVDSGKFPSALFLREEDKLQGIRELQQAFNQELRQNIKSQDIAKTKTILVDLVRETLTEPRSGSLEGLVDTVDILTVECAQDPAVLKTLANVYFKDYTTAIHSVNVMALTLAFSLYSQQSLESSKIMGLAALLHDVGKTGIDQKIIRANRRLTDEEFAEMKRHPTIGYKILKECDFANEAILDGAREHHEKLDGSGYPRGISRVSVAGQTIGLVDCYEAVTNDDRPYRSAMDPLEALKLVKREVEAGKFDSRLFERFAHSLAK